uniref:AP-1 complex subunit sigma-2 n=1 Tax=Astatotilapia calliptera TaxID=8154 RepID=A0AAX7SZA0_ASTCA
MFEVMKFEWAGRSGLIAVRSSQSFVCCLISALTKAGTTKTCQPIKIIMFALVANQKVVIDWPCFWVVLGGSFLPRGVYTVLLFKMQFMLLFSRQGKLRLQKWYVPLSDKEKKKITRELVQTVLARKPKMCSFLEWRDLKIVYKRYASLYFCCAIEDQDNELITLEIIHRYVELLDKYFGSVCELDIIFNFEKAYFILDEFLLGGEAQETSKKNVLKAIEQADLLQEPRHEYFNVPVY